MGEMVFQISMLVPDCAAARGRKKLHKYCALSNTRLTQDSNFLRTKLTHTEKYYSLYKQHANENHHKTKVLPRWRKTVIRRSACGDCPNNLVSRDLCSYRSFR